MYSAIIQYLTAKIENLNAIQKVYGYCNIISYNGEEYPSVVSNGENVHLNFDLFKSISFILKNGNVSRSTEEHPYLANAEKVTQVYPLRLVIYSQNTENENCESLSQQIADYVSAQISGYQTLFISQLGVDSASIKVTSKNTNKYDVWGELYSTEHRLKESDVLISVDFEFEISGDETCFTSSPCESSEFSFEFTNKTFCERVDDCLDIPSANGNYVLKILNGVKSWVAESAGGGVWGSITGTITNQTDLVNYITTRLTGYATEAFVTSQGYITNVLTALGYTPENVANKSDSYTASSSTTYASTKALVDGLATKNGQINPITQFSAFTHFTEIFPGIGAGATGAGVWELGNGWVLARSSSGAFATPQPAEVGRPGIVRHSTGSINSYNQIRCGSIWVSSAPLLFKGHFRIQTLSAGGQQFVITCGFQTGGTLVAPTNAIRIFLTDANLLQVEVIKSSVSLVVNTGITVAINTHYDIVITKADTTNECQFWVNGVNVYSLTNPADIATYVPQNLSMECHNSFQKVNGTNDRTFDTDFDYVTNNLPI